MNLISKLIKKIKVLNLPLANVFVMCRTCTFPSPETRNLDNNYLFFIFQNLNQNGGIKRSLIILLNNVGEKEIINVPR